MGVIVWRARLLGISLILWGYSAERMAPSEDVMDDLMTALGSCTATQYITQLRDPACGAGFVGVALGQSKHTAQLPSVPAGRYTRSDRKKWDRCS